MCKTKYILRNEKMKLIQNKLTKEFNMKLCFRSRNECIFKNDELLITCKNKYASILSLSATNPQKVKDIITLISKDKRANYE